MKLKEALPKPGQVSLGGVSSSDPEVIVSGYGKVKYGQLIKLIDDSLDKIKKKIEPDQRYSFQSIDSPKASLRDRDKKQFVSEIEYHKNQLNLFLDAFVKYNKEK